MRAYTLIDYALGKKPVDLLIRNAKLVNVLSGELEEESVAIKDGFIVGLGEYEAKEVYDAKGMYLSPGFIDAHAHFESSLLSIQEFAHTVVRQGTTTVVFDPHEIANVSGKVGLEYVLQALIELPITAYLALPSCVPATEFETSGAILAAKDLIYYANHPRVIALGEVMNVPAVLCSDTDMISKIALFPQKKKDGHAPNLRGKELNAYLIAGIDSDHETYMLDEGREKLSKGMQLYLRQGTASKNMVDLLPLIKPNNAFRFCFCTDDRHSDDLIQEGHMDYIIRLAIEHGLDPMLAYQIATIHTANHFHMPYLGAIKAGYLANLVLLSELKSAKVEKVWHRGIEVPAEKPRTKTSYRNDLILNTVHVPELLEEDFRIPATTTKVKVIEIIPDQLLTNSIIRTLQSEEGFLQADIINDVLPLFVVERHKASGNIGKGFVKGFGLHKGAFGSTVAHDSHNMIICGTNARDIHAVYEELKKLNGGIVVVNEGAVIAALPLPMFGLLSQLTAEEVAAQLAVVSKGLISLGCQFDDPVMTLSFLSLPPIPALKLTDKGLVDSVLYKVTSLYE